MSKKIEQSDFPVIILRRDDLEVLGFDGSHLDDESMTRLAESLGEGYWEQMSEKLETLVSNSNVPKISQS